MFLISQHGSQPKSGNTYPHESYWLHTADVHITVHTKETFNSSQYPYSSTIFHYQYD